MKNLGIALVLTTLFFVTMAFTCTRNDKNHHSFIRFVNNSDKSIYVYGSMEYPDTLRGSEGGFSSPYKIYPNTENADALRLYEYYEDLLGERGIPSDTLMVYVLDAELFEDRDIHIYDAVIQRYDLSLQDLQHVNWRLAYPPSPNMSAIKMYPPYGSEGE